MDPLSLFMIAIVIVALFFINRKGRGRQNAVEQFRAALAPGQEIMTASGLFATIVAVDGDVVTLETSPGVTSRWLRRAILERVTPEQDEAEVDDDEAPDLDADPAAHRPSLVKDDLGLAVPDDASSLTAEPGDEDDAPRP